MAKSSPSEKRVEERLIQDLRDFQRSKPTNKRCFDCNEMMPQYVCLDFNTFVCTACSGIHREFAHRVKSISMSKFTESEVKNMINHGGNEAAQKYWRNKHDPSFRPNGGNDGERTRNFIRLTYIDRKWVYESPRHAKEEPERTSSKSSKSKKEKKTDSDDDFFSSKPAKKSSEADTGFGDFSNFEGSSRTAATTQSFGDFGDFESPAPAKDVNSGFADFGDFEGSSVSSSTVSTAPKETPKPAAPKFGSFKIASPPGSNFSSSSMGSPPATSDLMGLSPPKKADDPFGFNTPAPPRETPAQPVPVASPFDDFDVPTPTSRAGSRSNSVASLDPFSNMTSPTPLAPALPNQNVSPFDAFGPPAAATTSPAFDDFAAPSPAPKASSNVFDAFGGGGDAFGDFTGSNSSSRTNSANQVTVDPFARKPEKSAPAADPFAAFDDMPSNGSTSTASTPDFGSAAVPGGNTTSQQQATNSDPFAFASGASPATNQPFGGFPGDTGGFPQQHHPQNAFNGQTQQPVQPFHQGQSHHQQQQPQNAFNGQMHQPMQPFHQGQPQQQQWYGQPQGFPGQQQPMHPGQQFPRQQQQMHPSQQFPGQHPPRPAGGTVPPAPIPVKAPASAASINDPFASLNIGTFGSSSSNSTAARTGSGGAASSAPFPPTNRPNSFGSAPTPAPFAYGQPQTRSSSSFTHAPQSNAAFADPNAFGDFTSAPTKPPASPANPFDLF